MPSRTQTLAARGAVLTILAAALLLPAEDARAQAGADLLARVVNLNAPIGLAHAGDGTNRLFIVEQAGCIRFYIPATNTLMGAACGVTGTRFLDIRSRITSGGERGLLGLAFHPQYATNGFFYVYYTSVANPNPPARNLGDIVLARYSVTSDPNIADPNSEQILLVIPHSSQSNHNGGQLNFGPDGFLYIAVGDGGGGGDPFENAQDTTKMLGKLHRIDVNVTTPPFYRIPPTNPIQTGGPGTCADGCDEIWAWGLRNPWRFNFDRATGDLYIGDVGQSSWEEVDYQPAGAPGGRNYGWDVLEGGLHGSAPVPTGNCFENIPAGSCVAMINGGSTLPIIEYDRATGSTVIGGTVYRGPVVSPLLTGAYVYADYGSGRIWRATRDGSGNWQIVEMFNGQTLITSFGEDDRGNLYFTRGNSIYQLFPVSVLGMPSNLFLQESIERMYALGLTAGCSASDYCPDAATTRAQMAVFVLRADDAAYAPPPCGSSPMFKDVDPGSPYCGWIEELARRNAAAGCGGGAFCPEASVSRAEMAAFTLAAVGGPGYRPPACGAVPMFSDVPAASPFCPWVEELARRGVVAGCGEGRFCAADPVSRADTAVFLVKGFGLE